MRQREGQRSGWPTRRSVVVATVCAAGASASGCAVSGFGDLLPKSNAPGEQPAAAPAQQPAAIGAGKVKVGLVLPMSANGNAALVAQSMKNAAEMALAEFNNPDLQLLVKDDGGTAQGAQQAAQQAIDEGAELILGPLFAHTVGSAAQVARGRGVPVIAYSTDANVASRGVYLLSFLPESDVIRIVDYAVSQGKRSFAALLPDNAYGSVVEGAFRQATARRNARVVVLERYSHDRLRMAEPVNRVAQAAGTADALFIPDGGDGVPAIVEILNNGGVNLKRLQLIGTGLWDDTRILSNPALQGGLFAAPDAAGFRAFAGRFRARFGDDPVRTATLAYDSVALVAALAKTQGQQRFSVDVLTNSSGFAGVDGVFRFRPDGTCERGLAVVRITPQGPQLAAPAPRAFA